MADESPVPRAGKRMRLGTRSCAECRRRKIRCIFPEGSRVCAECRLHEVVCRPQEPRTGGSVEAQRPSEANERLGRIEALFRRVCRTAGIDIMSDDLEDFEAAASRLVEQLQADYGPASPPSPGGTSPRMPTDASSSSRQMSFTGEDEIPHPVNAPLLEFVRDSLLVDTQEGHAPALVSTPAAKNAVSHHRRRIIRLLPSDADLSTILSCTSRYWALWPLHPSQLSPSKGLSISVVSVARSFIHESIQGDQPGTTAKALVWLALCIQQLPKDQLRQLRSVSHTALTLVLAYMEESDALLALDANEGGSFQALECLVLQTKCYVNMGRPRRAWMSLRGALTKAMLLGLHRPVPDDELGSANLWATIWRLDRQLSMVLGLPDAVPELHPSLSEISSDHPLESQIMHRMAVLCGSINSRNQNGKTATYSTTVQLDEELDSLQQMLPTHWWNLRRETAMPLGSFHIVQSLKLNYYQLRQMIHLPYMTRSFTERRYEHSRLSVLEASEGMIRTYGDRRLHPDGAAVICFLIDFLAFSAGLVLATDLISRHADRSTEAEEQKWEVILHLVCELRYASTLLDYPVVARAAQLLEYLHQARHGMYDGPAVYEAAIPYFGKVRIRSPTPRASLRDQTPVSSTLSERDAFSGVVELSTNMFGYNQLPCQLSGEFDMDWTEILDADVTYDWNGVFDFGVGPS